jgi:hypothetical protein
MPMFLVTLPTQIVSAYPEVVIGLIGQSMLKTDPCPV